MLIFIFSYIHFFNNAHTYNHWYLFGFLHDIFTSNNLIKTLLFLGVLLFIAIEYFNKKNILLNSDLVVLSGLLGSLLLFESTEKNHSQFFIAAYPFIILSLLKEIF